MDECLPFLLMILSFLLHICGLLGLTHYCLFHLQVYLDCVICVLALSLASSGREFDPRTRAFSDEELKPQPMIKKSRKQVLDSYKPVCACSITNHNCICTAALNRNLQCCFREEWRFLWKLSFLNTFIVDIPTWAVSVFVFVKELNFVTGLFKVCSSNKIHRL